MKKSRDTLPTSIKNSNADFDEKQKCVEIAEYRVIHYNLHERTDNGENKRVAKKRTAYGESAS